MPGGWEWLIIIGVLVLLFGAKRLPEMARSVGQSARVFKGEMKGIKDDEGRNAPQGAPQQTRGPPRRPARGAARRRTPGQRPGPGTAPARQSGTAAGGPVRRPRSARHRPLTART